MDEAAAPSGWRIFRVAAVIAESAGARVHAAVGWQDSAEQGGKHAQVPGEKRRVGGSAPGVESSLRAGQPNAGRPRDEIARDGLRVTQEDEHEPADRKRSVAGLLGKHGERKQKRHDPP